ncbi:MAG: translation elongation factor Ts [Rickettsiaceae bacterium]
MTISASLVKDLRAKTSAGMMDCKKALMETKGDFDAAVDWLRTKGLSAAAKKVGRIASEGLTALAVVGNKGAAIEVNSETDFVSRNHNFQNLVKEISELAVNVDDIESLKTAKTKSGKSVNEEIIANITTIGENITLRRMQTISVQDGVIASYVHNTSADNMGTISALVALESTGDKTKLMEVGRQIAMHIAASKPKTLNKDGVDQELIQKEKDIFTQQSRESGRPDNIIEKMIDGRIRKFLEEIVLLEQTFVIDNKSKISEVISNLSKDIGAPIELKSFIRFEIGEGVEKGEKNFADEVAAVASH